MLRQAGWALRQRGLGASFSTSAASRALAGEDRIYTNLYGRSDCLYDT